MTPKLRQITPVGSPTIGKRTLPTAGLEPCQAMCVKWVSVDTE